MKIINLYAGPSAGKSTVATELFTTMKKLGYKVEYIPEVAKNLIYSNDLTKLSDQLLVFALQHHELVKLEHQLDYVVVDSPLLLSLVYFKLNSKYDFCLFQELIKDINNSYDNIDIFLDRGEYPFEEHGRIHTLEESLELDLRIKEMLEYFNINFHTFTNNQEIIKNILKII